MSSKKLVFVYFKCQNNLDLSFRVFLKENKDLNVTLQHILLTQGCGIIEDSKLKAIFF